MLLSHFVVLCLVQNGIPCLKDLLVFLEVERSLGKGCCVLVQDPFSSVPAGD